MIVIVKQDSGSSSNDRDIANMVDQVPQHLDDSFEWEEFTSKNGKPYKVGVKKTEHAVEGDKAVIKSEAALKGELDIAGIAKTADAYSVDVCWEVDVTSDSWKDTSAEVKNLGISRYRILWKALEPYPFTLHITNTKGWGFWFQDEEGDLYTIYTIANHDHQLSYSSNGPNIVKVGRI